MKVLSKPADGGGCPGPTTVKHYSDTKLHGNKLVSKTFRKKISIKRERTHPPPGPTPPTTPTDPIHNSGTRPETIIYCNVPPGITVVCARSWTYISKKWSANSPHPPFSCSTPPTSGIPGQSWAVRGRSGTHTLAPDAHIRHSLFLSAPVVLNRCVATCRNFGDQLT